MSEDLRNSFTCGVRHEERGRSSGVEHNLAKVRVGRSKSPRPLQFDQGLTAFKLGALLTARSGKWF